MDRVFFTNSGAEAVEGAIKAARKYAYLKDGCTDREIIAMNHSFHGRTMGALSVTGNPKYREAFQPMIGHIRFADLNDFQSVLDQVTDKTCAIIMETVQGEGGLYPATGEFLKQVRDLCNERDILLILDEIQCGMGRTGYMYAWQRFGVKPDIMTSAKALGCGVPVGAFMMTEKVAQHSLTAGDHGTTYGGNPLACAAVEKVLDLFEEDHIIENVREVAPYLEEKLEELKEQCGNHRPTQVRPDMPFGAWMDYWYQNFSKTRLRPTTQLSYEGWIYNHLIPGLGHIQLNRLTQADLQQFLRTMKESGRKVRLHSGTSRRGTDAGTGI